MLNYVDKYNKYKYKYKNLKLNISGGADGEPYIFYQDIQWVNENDNLETTLQKIIVAKHIEKHIKESEQDIEEPNKIQVIIKEKDKTKYTDAIYEKYKNLSIVEYLESFYKKDGSNVSHFNENIKKYIKDTYTNSKYLLQFDLNEQKIDIGIIKANFYEIIKNYGKDLKDILIKQYYSTDSNGKYLRDDKGQWIETMFFNSYEFDKFDWTRLKDNKDNEKNIISNKIDELYKIFFEYETDAQTQMKYLITEGLMDEEHVGLKGFKAWSKNFINELVRHIDDTNLLNYNFYIMGDSTIDYGAVTYNTFQELQIYNRKAIFKETLKSEMMKKGRSGEVFIDVVGSTGFLIKDSSFSLEEYKKFPMGKKTEIDTMALPAFITLLNELIKAEVIKINIMEDIGKAPYLVRLIKNFFIDQKENNKYTHFAFIGFDNDTDMYIKGSYGQKLFDFKYLINMIKIVKRLVYFIVKEYDEINKCTYTIDRYNILTSLNYN